AAAARAAIERILVEDRALDRTRHLGQMGDIAPLLASASAVLFPVDDLYGKVDLPLVLLESLALGIPLILVRGGPLEAISAADFVDPGDAPALAQKALAILQRTDAERRVRAEQS